MRVLRILLIQLFAVCCLYVVSYSQIVGPAGGGGAPNVSNATGVLPISNGGTGVSTAPTGGGQLLVSNNAGTLYNPQSLSQDCTLIQSGVITCLKTNNVAFTALATASVPLSFANGGTNQTTGATSFCMGSSASIATATTDFITCGENPGVAVIGTETNSQQLVPAVCTISNLSVKISSAANANVPIITVDKNTTGQTLTCTVANAATTCTDVTHSFTTAAGDLLSIKLANPASANATGVVYIAFQINC